VETLAFRGDFRVSRMHRLAERGETIDRHAKACQAVCQVHRAAARMNVVDDDFAQTAVPGCGRDHRAEGGNVRHRREIIQRPALAHQRDHFVHKTIETGYHAASARVRSGNPIRDF